MAETETNGELPIEGGAPRRKTTEADPLARAQAERKPALAEIERLSKQRIELRQQGTSVPPEQHVKMDADLAAAGRRLGAADLKIKRLASGVPFDDDKFRRERTRAFDLHQSASNRISEAGTAHARLNGSKNEIAAFEASDDFKILQDNLRRVGRGDQMSDHAVRLGARYAHLQEIHVTAKPHAERTAAAAVAAKERWRVAKAVVDAWEEAIAALPGGARMLADIPKPHQRDDFQGIGEPMKTVSIGPNAMPRDVMQPAQSAPAKGSAA